MWGLDFGIGATTEFNIDHSTMNLLLTSTEHNFTPLKKIEHELVNGLGYAEDNEIAMWHFRIIAEILKTDVVEKYYNNESMYGELKSKWMEHLDGMLNTRTHHMELGETKIYAYEAIMQFESGNYRLSGFNLGQMMKMIKMYNDNLSLVEE